MGANSRSLAIDPRVANDYLPALAWLDAAIHREILRLRARYELSMDELRGLYVSDEHVARLLETHVDGGTTEEIEIRCESLRNDAVGIRPLAHLRREFDLSDDATLAVFIAIAPELNLKYQTLFAYLNDDASRKWASIDLFQRLTGGEASSFEPQSSLFREGILETIPGSSLHWRATGAVAAPPVRNFLAHPEPGLSIVEPAQGPLADAVGRGALRTIVIEMRFGASLPETVREIANHCGFSVIEPNLETPDRARSLKETFLSARLRQAAVFFPAETFALDSDQPPPPEARRMLSAVLHNPAVKIFAVDRRSPWRTFFEEEDYETVFLQPPPSPVREELWQDALRRNGLGANPADVASVSRMFSLFPPQIERAAAYIRRHENVRLQDAARRQCSTAMDSLAQKVETENRWEHLILPAATMQRLQELAAAIRHRETVFHDWSFLRQSGGKASLTALFSGASGTGKSMSVGVLANDLGLELYRIDLSAVVSKYIGETESNLERIFRAAEGSNAILFFDEADALFGKRSEVKDAHDRYANIEIAYLLQRMEAHEGVVILATNLTQNIDEAFSRRIQFEIEYPLPDELNRERLWRLLIPDSAPREANIDYPFLARQFALAGGDIRNVALDAAFLAAHENTSIGMSQLVRALARQRKKQGKLPSVSEFKQYFELIRTDVTEERKINP